MRRPHRIVRRLENEKTLLTEGAGRREISMKLQEPSHSQQQPGSNPGAFHISDVAQRLIEPLPAFPKVTVGRPEGPQRSGQSHADLRRSLFSQAPRERRTQIVVLTREQFQPRRARLCPLRPLGLGLLGIGGKVAGMPAG